MSPTIDTEIPDDAIEGLKQNILAAEDKEDRRILRNMLLTMIDQIQMARTRAKKLQLELDRAAAGIEETKQLHVELGLMAKVARAAQLEVEELKLELEATAQCAEDRRERAKRAEREVEELRYRYEPSSFRKDID